MSLSAVRTYFKSRIAEEDSDFQEWDDVSFENIPRSGFNKAYHLEPLPMTSTPKQDLVVYDSFPWVMRLFFKGFRTPQDALDTALDTAHAIRIRCVRVDNAQGGDPIKDVNLDTLSPESVDSNDNAIIIELTFTVQLAFAACV